MGLFRPKDLSVGAQGALGHGSDTQTIPLDHRLTPMNAPEDVFRVLREYPDMLIREEHIAAYRIGWGAKSLSILELAEELNLGLDSFLFLDDNPVECAEVGAATPELLGLQIPREDAEIAGFNEHLWALDRRAETTSEDRKRADRYRDEQKRK